MGTKYDQFTLEERCEITRLQADGCSIRQIAAALDRSPSSISRELRRNRGQQDGYKAGYAQARAKARRWKGSKLDRNAGLREEVVRLLRKGWSPEQVCGFVEGQYGGGIVGPDTIYRFIAAKIARHKDYSWRQYLPRAKAKRGRRGKRGGSSALHIQQRISIAERPFEIENRSVPGHWEADLMLFARYGQAILTLHERSSRLLIAAKPQSKAALPIAAAIARLLEPLPAELRQSITFDNGTEFARHYELHRFDIATFFCDPYAPWQKGGIENAIGRMRRAIPTKTDLAQLSQRRLASLISAYNNMPRKCLDWNSPAQVFLSQVLHFKRESTFPLSRE